MAPKWHDEGEADIAGMDPRGHHAGDGRDAARARAIDDLVRRTFAAVPAPIEPDQDGLGVDRFVQRLIAGTWAGDDATSMAMLVAAARRLGGMWDEDTATFWDVTIGLSRLSQELMAIERALPPHDGPMLGRFLLSAAPGDQHGLGIATVAVALRAAGSDVTADLPSQANPLVDAVRYQRFAVIGLSVGHERALAPVADLVAEIRSRSMNRDVRIALGGAILNGRGDLARALGADIHADDAAGLVQSADAYALQCI